MEVKENWLSQQPGVLKLRAWMNRHKVLAAIAFVVILLIIMQIPKVAFAGNDDPTQPWDTTYDTTTGVTGIQSICVPDPDPDFQCLWSTQTEVSKFKSGYFTKASGFHPKQVFVHPADARDTIATKIAGKITSANRSIYLNKYGVTPQNCTDRCLAYKLYDEEVNDASCATKGIPSNAGGTCVRDPQSNLTRNDVEQGISAVLCGTGVAIAIVLKAPMLVAGSGAATCTWNIWKDSAANNP